MDKVVNDLFENCDIENSGYVKVSDLINFIEPFLKENMYVSIFYSLNNVLITVFV